MYRLNKISLWIIIMVLVLIIAILITDVEVNDVILLRRERVEQIDMIDWLEGELEGKDFAYTAASMELDNLEQIIASKDELILELQVDSEMYELTREMLDYCISYIRLCQTTMIFNGIDFPEFILGSVMDDDFWEELEEQERYFEGVMDD